jgi:hypothetical protein
MNIQEKIKSLESDGKSNEFDFTAVLPPAITLAKIIASFANTTGGYFILGMALKQEKVQTVGLSDDFFVGNITHKSVGLLSPAPDVSFEYVLYKNKRVYLISIKKSADPILLENVRYYRENGILKQEETGQKQFRHISSFTVLEKLYKKIQANRAGSSEAKTKFLDHYQGILHMADDMKKILFGDKATTTTKNHEGCILLRILFSSCVDNFETYLSNLLYEIFLAKPETLKSGQMVSVKEVLECSDMQEFVIYLSRKNLSKLQRGSVKGFLSENKQISDLAVINKTKEEEIEKIFQVRHLYAHRNGVIDEKFQSHFPGQYKINDEHILSLDEFESNLTSLVDLANLIDQAAITKYTLTTIS